MVLQEAARNEAQDLQPTKAALLFDQCFPLRLFPDYAAPLAVDVLKEGVGGAAAFVEVAIFFIYPFLILFVNLSQDIYAHFLIFIYKIII